MTVATKGAASKFFGFLGKTGAAIVGGAAAGAPGSAASQEVGVATGIQDKFSFKGVGSAIGQGVLNGLASIGLAAHGFYGGLAATFGAELALITVVGIANAATRSALTCNSLGGGRQATIPNIIRQAVGSAIGGRIDRRLTCGGGANRGDTAETAEKVRQEVLPPATQGSPVPDSDLFDGIGGSDQGFPDRSPATISPGERSFVDGLTFAANGNS
ncbi:MAG: hypothetical protein AAGA08_16790 [Pseudomonadota bacterium]